MAPKFDINAYKSRIKSPSQEKIQQRINNISNIQIEGPGKIQCLLDNTWHYEITPDYLKSIGSTLAEYKRKYPLAKTKADSKFDDDQRNELSQRMSNNWQKHHQGQTSAATLAIQSRKKTP